MLIIFGVNLIKNKKVNYALCDLFGIGLYRATQICNDLNLAPQLKIKDLTEQQQFEISKKIKEEYKIEGNLKEEIKTNIQRYLTNGSIRGFRHRNKLPVRGQRTQSNAKTVRRLSSVIKN